ncbi:ras-related protein Rab-24-like [Tigriopus californicus]|uniref:ras-related protein Rab-24-like n=1 Tax=Tigriopus californicus TaxID=6832 RepID=UPI0027DA448C|nr:ras-related protein Rab-24-like [Tigriopus californicus]
MSPPSDVKVVLLGTEYCGKSSLVERYLHDRFRGENCYQNTVGAAYGSKLFEINVNGSPRALIMGIWDTAGSERYQSMSRLYYRSARAAILCFDITCRESWAKVQFWKKEVQRHERLCRIYLCATKMDKLLAEDQADGTEGHAPAIEGAVVSRFAQESEAALFHTSSKTGQQIAWDFVQDPVNFTSDYDSLVDLNRRESRRDKYKCCFFF